MMHQPHVIAVIPHELLLVILERHIASEEVSIAAEERVRSVPLDMQDFGVWKWSHDQTEILEVHRHIVGGLCCVGRNFGKGRDMVGAFRCQRLCAAESSALVIENITRKVYRRRKVPQVVHAWNTGDDPLGKSCSGPGHANNEYGFAS